MVEGVNYIGQSKSNQNKTYFQAFNPARNKPLPDKFYIASEEEVDQTLKKAAFAFKEYRLISGKEKAEFLDQITEEILALGDTLLEQAVAESGLPKGRFEGERGRTVNQINMFADLLREGSWVDARIDTAQPGRSPVPKADLRNMLFPIGPVVVFGASNFPLAFSTAGGDTASALASGCPVVVKSHESHPGTNELVATAILKAAKKTGMPDGVFSSLNGKAETGNKLVIHPLTKAIAFTGSLNAGKAIFKAATSREEPIPVYAEMGSINPVFLLQNKLNAEAEELADTYFRSVTLGKGQFCTKPGIIIGKKSPALDTFKKTLEQKLNGYNPDCLLNTGVAKNYRTRRDKLLSQTGVHTLKSASGETDINGSSSLAAVSAHDFIKNRALHEEVFGPFTLIVECDDDSQFQQIAEALSGQLTVTLMGEKSELTGNADLINACREKAGRVIFNGVPTGVEVCPSMQHGGPYPSTTDSKFTSVGTGAIRRFVRPIAFQDCPEELLPDELKTGNPLGIYRILDGSLKK